jgi:ketosteroid isomerase-like protein
MTRDQIETKIRELYAKRLRNDAASVTGYFGADVRFALCGDPAASRIACCVDCHDDLCAMMEGLVEAWRWREVAFRAIIIDGDRAAAHYRLTVTHAPSERTFETDIVDVMTFSGDKIVEFSEFVDTAMADGLLAAA